MCLSLAYHFPRIKVVFVQTAFVANRVVSVHEELFCKGEGALEGSATTVRPATCARREDVVIASIDNGVGNSCNR